MKRIFALITAAILTLPLIWSCTEEQETPKVQSISINQEDMTLEEGESVNLTATILPEETTDKTVAWSSSNDEIVMISSNGKAKAMATGEAIITAKAGDKSDFITITVVAKAIPVTGLSLNPSSISLKVGESQTIAADVTPQNATEKNVTWESSNPEVASVNNGTVTGLNPGSVTITATTVNGGKTADCSVTVKANLAPSVTIDADHVSAISAVLSGEANLETSGSSDLTMGIMLSTNSGVLPSNSTKIEAKQIEAKEGFEASYCYNVDATGLEPATTYYYRSYVTQNGQDTYGETKEFTTKDVASLLETREASGVEAAKATLNAKLDLTDVLYKSLAYGFLWGTSESALNIDFKCTEIKDNAISAVLTNLSSGTQHWYKVYVQLDSQTFYGEVKTFTTDVVPVESVSLDKTEYTFNTIVNTLTLKATVLPVDATDKSLNWISSDTSVATVNAEGKVTAVSNGTATIKAEAKDGSGKYASCSVTVTVAVDLGLSVYWGTTNIGASKPEDYGDYYAWGETESYYSSQSPLTWKNGKSAGYNWASYKWCNGSSSTLTKYNTKSSYGTVDNKTVLDQEDDVASVKLGGKWRMPTDAEWTELVTKCTWTWVTNYNGSGINGRLVKATNGNSIFLPAAGRRNDTDLYDAGSYGYYWSSSLSTGGPDGAWYGLFSFNVVGTDYYGYRYYGRSVRPVSE